MSVQKTITFGLDIESHEEITSWAEKNCINLSALCRKLLTNYYTGHKQTEGSSNNEHVS